MKIIPIEYVDFVEFIVNEQDTKRIFLSLSELMILRYVADNRQIKLDKAQELTQVSEDEIRKSLANLIKYGIEDIWQACAKKSFGIRGRKKTIYRKA